MYQLGLLVIFGLSVLATAEETTCQTHRRNSNAENAPLQWDITCNEDTGKYDPPLQCTRQTPKWCACYNEEEAVTGPSRKTKTCECFLARDVAVKAGASNCDTPQCQKSGRFEKKQCCETRNGDECHCVDEHTGEPTDAPSGNRSIHCP